MFKISPADLCFTLANLGKSNEIFVDENVKVGASLALGRMLAL
jgi:quinolinate synthase